jgi:hypothetical protein
MKVKITGIQVKIIACVGSVGVGLSFICTNIVMPIRIGQTPRPSSGPSSGTTGRRATGRTG